MAATGNELITLNQLKNFQNNRIQLLWQGNWSSGTIYVPGFSNYRFFVLRHSDSNIMLYAFRAITEQLEIRASGLQISNTPNIFTYALSFSFEGDNLTWIVGKYGNIYGANLYDITISEIYGIC